MSGSKPLALLLTPVLPLPGGSGRALRAWGWLQELQRDYRVQVVLPLRAEECPAIPAEYPAAGVLCVGHAVVANSKWQRLLGSLLPWLAAFSRTGVADWLHCVPGPALQAASDSLDGEPVQRIVVFRLYLHDLGQAMAQRFPQAAVELDMDDLESRTRLSIAGSLLRMGRYIRALFSLSAALQYLLLERTLPGRYRMVYLAAQDDCLRIAKPLAGAVSCRPNRLQLPRETLPQQQAEEVRLLFVGTLNYPPNEEAVRFILTRLTPELRRSAPAWRITVVGRHASAELTGLLGSTSGVEFLADVEDLAACYAGAGIVLVPLLAGGGTKFKTLEGFAHRRPVVSTLHGVRGLGVVAGVHYLPAETPQEFARAIIQLAQDPGLAQRIADAGWQLCQREFRQG